MKRIVLALAFGYSFLCAAAPQYEVTDWMADGFAGELSEQDNIIYRKTPTVTNNGALGAENHPTDAAVLVNGSHDESAYTVGNSTYMEWNFAVPMNLEDIRFYTSWGGMYRNDVSVFMIYVQDAATGEWSKLPGCCFSSGVNDYSSSYPAEAYYHFIGYRECSTRYLRYYDDAGDLAQNIKAVKFDFGYQDHNYNGYTEIQMKGRLNSVAYGSAMLAMEGTCDYAKDDAGVETWTLTGVGTFAVATDDEMLMVRRTFDADGNLLATDSFGVVSRGRTVDFQTDDEVKSVVFEATPFVPTSEAGAVVGDVRGTVTYTRGETSDLYVFASQSKPATIEITAGGYAELLLVGGGGGGGTIAGGGGAGGFVHRKSIYLPAGTYEVMVGAGGSGSNQGYGPGKNGGDSTFGCILTAFGGGGGGSYGDGAGLSGGSGGGSCCCGTGICPGGAGIAGQGNPGGRGYYDISGGGGGAGEPGGDAPEYSGQDATCGKGGDGLPCDITGETVWYAGGGGGGAGGGAYGGSSSRIGGAGGKGGGGAGHNRDSNLPGDDGVNGLGGGGGGGCHATNTPGGRGGDGTVILKVYTVDMTDAQADVEAYSVTDIGFVSATFNWDLIHPGTGSETAKVELEYGRSRGIYENAVVLDESAATGRGSAAAAGFSEGVTYYARYRVTGDGEGAESGVSSEFTFTTIETTYSPVWPTKAALWEVRLDGNGCDFDTDILAIAEGDGTNQRHLAPNPEMMYTTWGVKNPLTEQTYYWSNNSTWCYRGYMYFHKAGNWKFATSMDDTALIRIGGVDVHRIPTYTSNAVTGWTCPAAGWYEVDLRAGDFGGNSGPIGGAVAFHWSTDDGATWNPFGTWDGQSQFRIDLGRPVTVVSSLRTDDAVVSVLQLDPLYVGRLSVRYGDDLSDMANWTSVDLGDAVGETSQTVSFGVTGTPAYYRFFITADGVDYGSAVSSFADVHVADAATPDAAFDAMGRIDPCQAELGVNVLSTGGGDACRVVVNYGLMSDDLSKTAEFDGLASGPQRVTLTSLRPETTYSFEVFPVSENGVTGAVSQVFSFTTGRALVTPGYREQPVRTVEVTESAVDGDGFAATLAFGPASGDCTLKVAWGYADGGSDPAAWQHTATVAAIPAATEAYAFRDSQVVGFGLSSFLVWFYVEDADGNIEWSDVVYAPPVGLPAFEDSFTADGTAGDSIVVVGRLQESVIGTAAVSVEVCPYADMVGARTIAVGEFGGGDEIRATVHSDDIRDPAYIRPGSTYYVRLVAVSQDGEIATTPVREVTTLAASAIEASLQVDADASVVHVVANVTALGAGGEATVVLQAGNSAASLEDVASKTVTATGEVSFDYDFGSLGAKVVRVVVRNVCPTASFEIQSAASNPTLVDNSTWYWVGPEGGDWTDAANWENSAMTPGAGTAVGEYPNSSFALVEFSRAAAPIKVNVNGTFSVARLVPGAQNLEIELVGSGKGSSRLNMSTKSTDAEFEAGRGSSITLKSLYWRQSDGEFVPMPDGAMVLDAAEAEFVTALTLSQGGSSLKLFNGAYLRFEESGGRGLQIHGSHNRVVIDNSTIRFANPWNGMFRFGIFADDEDNVIEFYGARPRMEFSCQFQVADQATTVDHPKLVFHIPEGGYAEDPIVLWTIANRGDGFNPNGKQFLDIEIADDSPALLKGRKFDTGLVYWRNATDRGLCSDWVNFITPNRATRLYYTYDNDGSLEPSVPGTKPDCIRVSFERRGFTVFVK